MYYRLDRVLSTYTPFSRTEIKKLIARGQVTVAGRLALRPDQKVDPSCEAVLVDGEPVECGFLYIMLNKPAGVVCATQDGRSRTVLELLPEALRRKNLFPAGRLDRDTTGFVLITDDGEFAHQILSPKRHVPKTYYARLCGALCPDAAERFAAGLTLEDGTACRPALLEALPKAGADWVRIVLHEGMYHQVKRMVAACGAEVEQLHREAIGGLFLDKMLKEGECRRLSVEEKEQLAGEVK